MGGFKLNSRKEEINVTEGLGKVYRCKKMLDKLYGRTSSWTVGRANVGFYRLGKLYEIVMVSNVFSLEN